MIIVHWPETKAGPHSIGLQFPDGCSYELFVGLRGLTSIPKVQSGPNEFDLHHWP